MQRESSPHHALQYGNYHLLINVRALHSYSRCLPVRMLALPAQFYWLAGVHTLYILIFHALVNFMPHLIYVDYGRSELQAGYIAALPFVVVSHHTYCVAPNLTPKHGVHSTSDDCNCSADWHSGGSIGQARSILRYRCGESPRPLTHV